MNAGASGSGRTVRVLHAEDDDSFRDLVDDLLAAEADIRVVSEPTPADALERLRNERFDCVISDYDGDEAGAFLPVIEATEGGPPCILLSGKEREKVDPEATAGIDGYVQKGSGSGRFEMLAERIRTHTERYWAAERHRALFEEGSGPMVVHDADTGAVIDMNPQVLELLNYERTRVSDMELADLLPEEGPYAPENARELVERAAAGETITREWECVTAAGDRIPVEVTLKHMNVAGTGRIAVTLRDIRERKRREAELQVGHQRMESLAAAFPDYAFFYDADGVYQEVWLATNRNAEIYLSEELVGNSVHELLDEEAATAIQDTIDSVLATGEVEDVEYAVDGPTSTYWYEGRAAPLPDDAKSDSEVVLVARDVTTRHEYEQRLERQNQRLDEFADVVAHDLRNPLNVVQGRLDLIASATDDESVLGHAEAAATATDRMGDLIEDLLTVARTEERKLSVSAVESREAISRAWSAVSEPRASLEVAMDATVRADEDELIRLLENLFRNSAEHAGPDVTIRVERVDGGFAVADDGPGIPDEHHDDVFDSGFSTASDGTGYGLDIVERIADAHGWDVSLTDGDCGARFEVTNVVFVGDDESASGQHAA
ncbi:MAG: PAS domain S-box protein [Halolamina sp.]